MAYRFRFYGRRPADWHEGANLGHAYEIAFARPPSDEEKAQLAALYEESFASGPVEISDRPWLWSGHVACFQVGERWLSSTPLLFSRVTDFLVNAHARLPIAQAIFWGVREEGSGGWDRWTRETQPVPDAGPPYDPPRTRPYGRPVDESMPVAAPDPVFEQARARAVERLARQRAAVALDRALAVSTKSGIGFASFEGEVPPKEPLRPELVPEHPLFGAAGEGQGWLVRQRPRLHALLMTTDCRRRGLSILDVAGHARPVEGVPTNVSCTDLAVTLDGRVLISWSQPDSTSDDLHAFDLERLVAEPVWTCEGKIYSVEILVDGNWLINTDGKLLVVDGDQSPPAIVASTAARGSCRVFAGGTGVFANGSKGASLFGYYDGKLKRLESVEIKPGRPVEHDGMLLAEVGGQWLALTGFEPVYEAWAGPLRNKEEQQRKGRPQAVCIELERFEGAVAQTWYTLSPHEIDADMAKPFAGLAEARLFGSPTSGRVVAGGQQAAWIDATGELQREKDRAPLEVQARFTPDGQHAVFFGYGDDRLIWLDFEADRADPFTIDGLEAIGLNINEVQPLAAHRLLTRHDKGIALWARKGKEWSSLAHAKVSKCKAMTWAPGLEVVAVQSEGKTRLLLYAVGAEKLSKIAELSERVNAVQVDGDTLRLGTVDGVSYTVRNLRELVESKR